MAPLAPDPCLFGAVDAKGVAAHLNEVNGAWLQARQATRGLVAHIVHHLGSKCKVRGQGGSGQARAGPGNGADTFQSTLSSTRYRIWYLAWKRKSLRAGGETQRTLSWSSRPPTRLTCTSGGGSVVTAGRGGAGLSHRLLRPGWPLTGFKSQSTWLRWHLLPFSPLHPPGRRVDYIRQYSGNTQRLEALN